MRTNIKVTLNPGTPVNVAKALGIEGSAFANRVSIQMAVGGAGYGSVMDGIGAGRTPSVNKAGDVTIQLAPASATSPGGQYGDPPAAIPFSQAPAIDLSQIWVDGSQADPVLISAVLNV